MLSHMAFSQIFLPMLHIMKTSDGFYLSLRGKALKN
jgi:hypothetical protein